MANASLQQMAVAKSPFRICSRVNTVLWKLAMQKTRKAAILSTTMWHMSLKLMIKVSL